MLTNSRTPKSGAMRAVKPLLEAVTIQEPIAGSPAVSSMCISLFFVEIKR